MPRLDKTGPLGKGPGSGRGLGPCGGGLARGWGWRWRRGLGLISKEDLGEYKGWLEEELKQVKERLAE